MSNLTLVEKQLSPKLRFKEFSGSWLLQRASDLFENSRIKGNGELPIYSVTLDRGMVRRDSLERRMGNDAKATDNLLVLKGDISYNMMRMWQGAYGQAPEDCMVSPAYVVLHPKEDTSAEFFIRYFERSRSRYLFTSYSYGLTSDRLRLYFKDFARIKYATPSLPEQQKIAAFLSAVDEKIQQLTRKKELLETYKKGLMQQLFSGDLRFKDEEGKAYPDWEEKRLGEVAEFLDERRKPIKSSDRAKMKGQYPYYGASGIIDYVNDYIFDEEIILLGEDGENIVSRNLPLAFRVSGKCWINNHAHVLRPRVNNDIDFITYTLESIDYLKYNTGTAQPKLNQQVCKGIMLDMPSFEEQQKISGCIKSIDQKIASISNQITQTQSFKKGLLQQMFV